MYICSDGTLEIEVDDMKKNMCVSGNRKYSHSLLVWMNRTECMVSTTLSDDEYMESNNTDRESCSKTGFTSTGSKR
jgi:hypothetical protein